MPSVTAALLEQIEALAARAGEAILAVYRAPFDVQAKPDGSPVTDADRSAELLIVDGLRKLAPEWPVIAEEAVARGEVPAIGATFWLVDPLDGTREFVARNGEFTVNIALVDRGRPVLGAVHAPALGRCYSGAQRLGAFLVEGGRRLSIHARARPASGAVAAVSRAHGDAVRSDAFLAREAVTQRLVAGSSLKFGLLAAGQADVYPRFGRTMEWDTAAGQAVLEAAGGRVVDIDGAALRYGKPGFENPDFVAWGAADAAGGKPRARPRRGGS